MIDYLIPDSITRTNQPFILWRAAALSISEIIGLNLTKLGLLAIMSLKKKEFIAHFNDAISTFEPSHSPAPISRLLTMQDDPGTNCMVKSSLQTGLLDQCSVMLSDYAHKYVLYLLLGPLVILRSLCSIITNHNCCFILYLLFSVNPIAAFHNTSSLSHDSQTGSLICSKELKQFQWEHLDLFSPHICDNAGTTTPWQLTQFVYPDLKVFLDIGANRGYTAAEFFGLWSPGHGLNRKNLFDKLKQDSAAGLYKNNEQLNTYCKDGHDEDKPIFCIGRNSIFPCLTRRSIQVYSFDGQRTHFEEVSGTIRRHFPHLTPTTTPIDKSLTSVKSTHEYIHAAMTDTIPTGVKFGYFKIDKTETGKLIKNQTTAQNGTDLVPLLTVDSFCQERKIRNVGVLKIDAEGSDDQVIAGATQTLLTRGVKVLLYECFNCMSDRYKTLVETLDRKFGFDCYQLGQYNLFLRLTNCWDYNYRNAPVECSDPHDKECSEFIRYKPNPAIRLDSNTFCVHRKRGAALHQIMETLSLHKYYEERRGNIHKDALLSNLKASYTPTGEITYVNPEGMLFFCIVLKPR